MSFEQMPSSSHRPTERKSGAFEVRHPKTNEELLEELRNKRVAETPVPSKGVKVGEEWKGKTETERPVSPFRELTEEEKQRNLEMVNGIHDHYVAQGLSDKEAWDKANEDIEKMEEQEEERAQALFNEKEGKKAEEARLERQMNEAADVATRNAKIRMAIERHAREAAAAKEDFKNANHEAA